MDLIQQVAPCEGIRFSVEDGGKEVAHAYMYILFNDRHDYPFAFLEDVFVEEPFRRRGIAAELCEKIVREAQKHGCYKIVATSRYGRPHVHAIYTSLGYRDHGKEFRLDF